MRLVDVATHAGPDTVRLTGVYERGRGGERRELYFEFPAAVRSFVADSADPFAALMLVPAMEAGEDLALVPPVSAQLLFGLSRVRDVFHTWYPELAPVAIHHSTLRRTRPLVRLVRRLRRRAG